MGSKESTGAWTVSGYLARTLALIASTLASVLRMKEPSRAEPGAARDLAADVTRWLGRGMATGLVQVLEGLRLLQLSLSSTGIASEEQALRLVDALAAPIREQLQRLLDDDPQAARLWEVTDIALATVRGELCT